MDKIIFLNRFHVQEFPVHIATIFKSATCNPLHT